MGHPIYDELDAERRSRTGVFASFALDPPAEPAPVVGPAPAVEEDPTEEEIAQGLMVAEDENGVHYDLPETEPLEQQIATAAEAPYTPPAIRSGRPRSQR